MTKKKSPRPRCTGTTRAGTQCPYSARPGTDPPRCGIHTTGGGPKAGAPVGNKNAEKHGYYSKPDAPADGLEITLADLRQKRARLSRHIDAIIDDIDPLDHAKLLDLLGRLDSRIERLDARRREREGRTDEIQDSIQDSLALVWRVLGIKAQT